MSFSNSLSYYKYFFPIIFVESTRLNGCRIEETKDVTPLQTDVPLEVGVCMPV